MCPQCGKAWSVDVESKDRMLKPSPGERTAQREDEIEVYCKEHIGTISRVIGADSKPAGWVCDDCDHVMLVQEAPRVGDERTAQPAPASEIQVKSFKFKHGVTITLEEEGVYIVRAPNLSGCVAHGYTVHEALSCFQDVYEAWLLEKGTARK